MHLFVSVSYVVFFFNQKTAYEMRISDWSSDVCSSDLRFTEAGVVTRSGEAIEADLIVAATGFRLSVMGDIPFFVDGQRIDWHDTVTYRGMMRSEERRGGKECGSTCRTRRSPYH